MPHLPRPSPAKRQRSKHAAPIGFLLFVYTLIGGGVLYSLMAVIRA